MYRSKPWGTEMTCKGAVGAICNYLEGSLSSRDVAALLKHLEHCKDCSLVLSVAQRTLEVDFDRAVVSATGSSKVA